MTPDATAAAWPDPRVVQPVAFADAMSRFATGVVLVTNWIGGRPWGMTVSAFASVSAEPPTILVSLWSETASARAIAAEQRFGVSILDRRHVGAARHGSVPGAAKFLERFVLPGDARSGLPVVADALAHLDCDLTEQVEVADHTVFFGRVRDVRVWPVGEPLLYFRRAYRTLDGPAHASTNGRASCAST